MPRKLKVGIISANWGVATHLPAWRQLAEEVEVTAICTAHQDTAEQAAKANDIPRAFWDYRAMCADPDLDIIDVGARPPLRLDMTMAALAQGKHVYAGIPFAPSLQAAQAMGDAQLGAGLVGCVDAYIQGLPATKRMKELIDDGFLGEPFGVQCNFQIALMNRPSATFGFKWSADPANGASALRNLGSHAFNTLVHLFGPVEELVTQGNTCLKQWTFDDGSTLNPGVHDTSMALLKFKSGLMGQFNPSWVAAAGDGFSLQAYGSAGRLRLCSQSPFHNAFDTHLYAAELAPLGQHHEQRVSLPERLLHIPGASLRADEPVKGVFGMVNLFKDMVQAIHAGGQAAPSFAQACHVQGIIEAAYRSIDTRAWVQVNPDRTIF